MKPSQTTSTENIPTENVLMNTPFDRHELAARLQDCWHYAALIKPPADGRESTFVGGEFRGLIGKLKAYAALSEKLSMLTYECFPIVAEMNIWDVEKIESEKQLLEQVGYAITVINKLAVANGIDAYGGEVNPLSEIHQAFNNGWHSSAAGATNPHLLTSDCSDAWVLGRWARENGIGLAVTLTVKKSRGYHWRMNGRMYRVDGVAVREVAK